jgi:hypothetical protein
MHGPEPAVRGPQVGRWILIAALILLGIALFFWYAPTTRPAASPTVVEER